MAKKEFTGINLTLPTGRLAYPVVFEQKYNDLKKKDEWAVTILFDKKTADLSKLKATIVQAAKNEFGANVDLKTLDLKRIIDGDLPNAKGEPRPDYYKGQWVVKAATRLKAPGVVDAQLNKILDPSEIYSGVYANVNVTVKAYSQPNQGVTLYLNHLQKVKDGEPIAGGPQVKDVFAELDIDENEVVATDDSDEMAGMFS
jgi:hypothetical protein